MDKKQAGQTRYPVEMKERAVRMVRDLQQADPNDKNVISRVARQLGVGTESLRTWVKQADVDDGKRPGLTTAEHGELVTLRKENRELRRANDILQAAASFMLTARLCRLPARAMAFNLFGAGGR
jgi:transposase-like protein